MLLITFVITKNIIEGRVVRELSILIKINRLIQTRSKGSSESISDVVAKIKLVENILSL